MRLIFIFLFSFTASYLCAQKSNYRRVLIFAPDSTDRAFSVQNSIFQKELAGCVERDIVVENYLYKAGQASFFKKYQIQTHDFTLILIGKDGLVRLRSKEVLPASRIYGIVDAMPMRKEEMRRKKKE